MIRLSEDGRDCVLSLAIGGELPGVRAHAASDERELQETLDTPGDCYFNAVVLLMNNTVGFSSDYWRDVQEPFSLHGKFKLSQLFLLNVFRHIIINVFQKRRHLIVKWFTITRTYYLIFYQ